MHVPQGERDAWVNPDRDEMRNQGHNIERGGKPTRLASRAW